MKTRISLLFYREMTPKKRGKKIAAKKGAKTAKKGAKTGKIGAKTGKIGAKTAKKGAKTAKIAKNDAKSDKNGAKSDKNAEKTPEKAEKIDDEFVIFFFIEQLFSTNSKIYKFFCFFLIFNTEKFIFFAFFNAKKPLFYTKNLFFPLFCNFFAEFRRI
jgi:hypothetical protein